MARVRVAKNTKVKATQDGHYAGRYWLAGQQFYLQTGDVVGAWMEPQEAVKEMSEEQYKAMRAGKEPAAANAEPKAAPGQNQGNAKAEAKAQVPGQSQTGTRANDTQAI